MCTLKELEYDQFETNEVESISTTCNNCADVTAQETGTNIVCIKCGSREIQISLRNKNGYCKACFMSMVTHKFKATLGKSKSVRPNDSILVAHSGKANSTVLTHLVKTNTNESASKRLQFRYKILYIDDGMVKGRTVEERELVRKALAKEAENLQLTVHIVSLSKCMTDDLSQEIQLIDAPRMGMTDDDALTRETFDKLESDTARDELLRQLRRRLLASAARELDCNKILVADTSLDLAVKVLGDVSTGRGSQLVCNVGFSDTRSTDVTLLRPLRDFTGEEVVGYLHCYDLDPILASSKYDRSVPASIRNIAKSFIHRLDNEFHGTVSTIYRTSEKLARKTEEIERINTKTNTAMNDSCILCELTLYSDHTREERLSVVQARTFSKLVSTSVGCSSNILLSSLDVHGQLKDERMESGNQLEEEKCRCNGTTCISSRSRTLQPEIIEKYFCYGCRLIFLSSNQTFNVLPDFLFNKIYEEVQMRCLRQKITDFLL